MKLISLVVPVFNEQDNVELFYQEVCQVMQDKPYRLEILFVDDGSTDATPLLLHRLVSQDSRVRALLLSRNFGHQVALTCGMDHACGDAVITMDGDLQHPPAMIPVLLAKWEQGYDVVQTIRVETVGASVFKKWTSRLFYTFINAISNVQIHPGGSDFRLMNRQVVESFRLFHERARFIRGMISAIGYRQTFVDFTAPPRHAGKSKFSLHKMLHFALDGVTAYSKTPLRLAFYMGVLLGVASFAVMLNVLYIKLFTAEAVPGWATITTSVLALGGMQLIGLGIIGEYVGRIFEEVKQRPLYLVRQELNHEQMAEGKE